MEVYDLILPKHLTDDLMMIYEVCGIETVRKLLKNYGGMTFYIPKLSRLEDFVMNYTKENRPHKSYKSIALDLNVSETHIRTVMKKIKDRAKYLKK